MKRNSFEVISSLSIAILAIGFAFYELEKSKRYENIMRADELTAQSVSLRDTKFDLSLLLSIEAYRLVDNPRIMGVLLDTVQANPQLIQYLYDEVGSPSSVAFSPDGKILAVGYSGGVVVLWDVTTGTPQRYLVATWEPPNDYHVKLGESTLGPVSSLIFSRDGKTLIASIYTFFADQRIVSLWDVTTGRSISQPSLEHTSPYDLVLSPNGNLLAISEWGRISFWDMGTNQFVSEFPVPQFDFLTGLNSMPVVSNPVFGPDGKTVAAITGANEITFWDAATLQTIGKSLAVGNGHPNVVNRIAFDQRGKDLLVITEDGALTSWNLETRVPTQKWHPVHTEESYMLYGYGAAFSRNARFVAISDGTVTTLLDTTTGQQIARPLKGSLNIGNMEFSPDGKSLASVGRGGVILWSLERQDLFGQIIGEHGGSSLAFSPNGKLLAADTFFDNDAWRLDVGLWDMTTDKFIGQLGSKGDYVYKPVVFSPNGKLLATGSSKGVSLWDVATRKLINQFQLGANTYLSSLAFSPDGKILAAGHDLVVTLWDLENGSDRVQFLITENTGTVESIAFSPNGKTIVVGASSSIILWDIKTRKSIQWITDSNFVDSIAFSPDGETIASTSRDGKIILWDVRSQKAIGSPFILPTNGIPTTLSFSPDGKLIASGSYDNSINLWDVATRQPISEGLMGNDWPVGQITFSPDGKSLATTSNKIILWDVNPLSWIDKICQRVGRNFTRNEWMQYFPEENYRATCPQWPLELKATPTLEATP
ncbi:MAG: PD40 domain-containing protein [Anaerolineales bacterium]|nr:PD40 domain-containing protein [Anaerolineales bacterium]